MSHRLAIRFMKHFLHLFHKPLHTWGQGRSPAEQGHSPGQRRKLRLGGERRPAHGLQPGRRG